MRKEDKKSSKKNKSKLINIGSTEDLKMKLSELQEQVDHINSEMAGKEQLRNAAMQKLSTLHAKELQYFCNASKKASSTESTPVPIRGSRNLDGHTLTLPSKSLQKKNKNVQQSQVSAKPGSKYGPLKLVTNIAEFRMRSSNKRNASKMKKLGKDAKGAGGISGSFSSLENVEPESKSWSEALDVPLPAPDVTVSFGDMTSAQHTPSSCSSSFETEVMAILHQKSSSDSSQEANSGSDPFCPPPDNLMLKPETIAVISVSIINYNLSYKL